MLAGLASLVAVLPAHAATSIGSWNNPGENPFKGSRWHAVMSYSKEMPLHHRIILGLRVQWSRPDMLLRISKHNVYADGQTFTSDIIGMHFGKRGRYETIDRSGWSDEHVEFAPAWCYESSCIGSPYVCNNIFAIIRKFDADTIRRDAEDRGLPFREEVAVVNEALPLWLELTVFGCCVWFTRRSVEAQKARSAANAS
jgi:hypothetical protein